MHGLWLGATMSKKSITGQDFPPLVALRRSNKLREFINEAIDKFTKENGPMTEDDLDTLVFIALHTPGKTGIPLTERTP